MLGTRTVSDHVALAEIELCGELMIAASEDPSQRMAAKSRFAEMFRAAARTDGSAGMSNPPCKAVLAQIERLEQLGDSPGLLAGRRSP